MDDEAANGGNGEGAPEPFVANADQAQFWRSAPGRKWVEFQSVLDETFAPVIDLLMQAAAPSPGEAVLDVGCGTGALSLAVAERIGPAGRVVALDISQPLLARAAERVPAHLAGRMAFVEADAQVHPFDRQGFDLLLSRFGVMFFEDPVAAFRNLAGALRPGARLHFAAWAPAELNPWFALPRDAAIARFGPPPETSPHAPGPFAFADRSRVLGLLAEAGLRSPQAEAVEIEIAPPGTLEDAVLLASNIGPAARMMKAFDGTPADLAAIRERVGADFAAFRSGQGIRVPGLLNLFSARAA